VEHVLTPFAPAELAWVSRVVDRAADAVLLIVESGLEAAMNRFNGISIPADDAGGTAGGVSRTGDKPRNGETQE
jgi:hypothetical protein